MTMERKLAAIFHLTDENWLRHANPWSVGTRYTVLPLMAAAFWSRVWLGWWYLVPAGLSLIWVFLNPVLFDKPRSTNNWASKSVLGERVYINRDQIAIPKHHQALPPFLNVLAGVGMIMAIWGLVALNIWLTISGILLAYLGKSWYLDRMVWLYEDMGCINEYQQWFY
ncbi:MAG: hypothetical protein PVH64_06875 [Bacillota bacterium]|jgi:hypothetical protein